MERKRTRSPAPSASSVIALFSPRPATNAAHSRSCAQTRGDRQRQRTAMMKAEWSSAKMFMWGTWCCSRVHEGTKTDAGFRELSPFAGLSKDRVGMAAVRHEKTRQLVAPGTYHSILIFPKSHACAHNVKQPVGGGDGKTDAETYPVSGEVSERWFVPKDDALSFVRWL